MCLTVFHGCLNWKSGWVIHLGNPYMYLSLLMQCFVRTQNEGRKLPRDNKFEQNWRWLHHSGCWRDRALAGVRSHVNMQMHRAGWHTDIESVVTFELRYHRIPSDHICMRPEQTTQETHDRTQSHEGGFTASIRLAANTLQEQYDCTLHWGCPLSR